MTHTKLAIALVSLMAITSTASKADSIELTYGTTLTHVYTDNLNEDNNLIGLSYSFDNDWSVNVSTFNNSYYNRTYTIGGAYTLYENTYIEIDMLGGLVNGYTAENLNDLVCPIDGSDYCVYLAPRITFKLYENDNIALKLNTMLFGEAIVGTVGAEFKF